jgi:hypothetical protein
MFTAPPRGGEIAGPTRGLGINGLRITFPELTLALPSIEFPGFTRFRRGAHMRLDRSVAPYMENPYYGNALLARQAQERQLREAMESEGRRGPEDRGGPSDCVAQPGSKAAPEEGDCEERLKALKEKMRKLEECLNSVQNELSSTPRPPAPPADFPPRIRPMPPTDVAGQVRQSSYEYVEPRPAPPAVHVRRLPVPFGYANRPPAQPIRRLPIVAEG